MISQEPFSWRKYELCMHIYCPFFGKWLQGFSLTLYFSFSLFLSFALSIRLSLSPSFYSSVRLFCPLSGEKVTIALLQLLSVFIEWKIAIIAFNITVGFLLLFIDIIEQCTMCTIKSISNVNAYRMIRSRLAINICSCFIKPNLLHVVIW